MTTTVPAAPRASRMAIALACALLPLCPAFAADPPLPVDGDVPVTLPRVDVQVSGTFQSLPGTLIFANYNAPNSVVQPSLGRALAGGSQNITVELVDPGSDYGDRINQLDLRFGKVLRFGRTRTSINVDVYNTLNSNSVLVESQAYATCRQPQQIMLARFAKVGVTFDF